MEDVKKYTQEELENLSREEFINVIIEITKSNEQLVKELDKQKESGDYWFGCYNEEHRRAEKAEAALAIVSKQRDSAIKAVSNLALAVTPAEQPTTQE